MSHTYFYNTYPQRCKHRLHSNFGHFMAELRLLAHGLHNLIDGVGSDAIAAVLTVVLGIRV